MRFFRAPSMNLPDLTALTRSLPALAGGLNLNGSSFSTPVAAMLGLLVARHLLFRGSGLLIIMMGVGYMLYSDHQTHALLSRIPSDNTNAALPSLDGILRNPAAMVGIIGFALMYLTGSRIVTLPKLALITGAVWLYKNPPVAYLQQAQRLGVSNQTFTILIASICALLYLMLRRNSFTARYPGSFAQSLLIYGQVFKALLNGVAAVLVIGFVSIVVLDRQLLEALNPQARAFITPLALACGITFLHRALPERYRSLTGPIFWAFACIVLAVELC